MRLIGFETTPNPNALKCLLDGNAPSCGAHGQAGRAAQCPARSYGTREESAGDPLAEALFSLEGITNILVMPGWVTVCKRPEAGWKSLKPKIKRIIDASAQEFESRAGTTDAS